MSKAQKYVLLPIDQKRYGILDSEAMVEKFAHRWGLTPVNIQEPQFTNLYWNAGMNAYLKRPRGYLRTHAVFVYLANTPLAARKAATEWHRWLDQNYIMKPLAAALISLIQDRELKFETEK